MPVAFVVFVAVAIVLEWCLRRTQWGLRLRAVGSDEESARRVGVRVNRTALLGYAAVSALTFLGAIMLMAQIGVGDPAQGTGYTLTSITAVVLGGTSLLGGRGTFIGTLLGAGLIVQVLNATTFLDLTRPGSTCSRASLIVVAAIVYSQVRRTGPRRLTAADAAPIHRRGAVMNIAGIHHTGLIVTDLDRSIAFYHDVLGLPFASEPTDWFSGEALDRGVRVPNATLRLCMFWAGPSSRLELLAVPRPLGRHGPAVPEQHARCRPRVLPGGRRARRPRRSWRRRASSSTPTSTSSTRARWPAGAGSTSPIPTGSRWSSWRSRTPTRRSATPNAAAYLRTRPAPRRSASRVARCVPRGSAAPTRKGILTGVEVRSTQTVPVRPRPTASAPRLRAIRLERGLGVRELARRLDVSPSAISQIETGKIQPSVRTLYALAAEFGVSVNEALFDEGAARAEGAGAAEAGQAVVAPGPGLALQRADGRRAITLSSGVRWERLMVWADDDTEFLEATYEPGGASSPNDAFVRHSGHEFIVHRAEQMLLIDG